MAIKLLRRNQILSKLLEQEDKKTKQKAKGSSKAAQKSHVDDDAMQRKLCLILYANYLPQCNGEATRSVFLLWN